MSKFPQSVETDAVMHNVFAKFGFMMLVSQVILRATLPNGLTSTRTYYPGLKAVFGIHAKLHPRFTH